MASKTRYTQRRMLNRHRARRLPSAYLPVESRIEKGTHLERKDSTRNRHRRTIVEFAGKNRLPASYGFRQLAIAMAVSLVAIEALRILRAGRL